MVLEEREAPSGTHVALEHAYRGRGQIHEQEGVEAVAKIGVTREGQDAAAELEILLQ